MTAGARAEEWMGGWVEARKHGGVSGARWLCIALGAASVVAARPDSKGKTIVVIIPSCGERYLSTPLFSE